MRPDHVGNDLGAGPEPVPVTPAPEQGQPTLTRRLGSAVAWVYFGQYTGKMLVFGATLVLARILAPADFALVAFILALLMFLDVADLGVGAALVWLDREQAMRDRNAVFTLHLIGATALTVLINVFAAQIATISGDPRAETAVHLLSLSLLLGALGATHENLLRRELDFRRRFWPDFGGGATKGVVAIVLALVGAGVWSLIFAQLVGTVVRVALLWNVVRFRPRFDLGRGGRAGKLIRFGLPLSLGTVVFQLVVNVDYVIVGNVLGLTILGYYVIAFRVPELILHGTLNTLSTVIFPYYARARELQEDVGGRYVATLRLTSMVAAPFVAMIAGLSAPIILTLFGEKWDAAIPLMPALALLLVMDSLTGYAGDLYKAYGRTWLLLGMESARLGLLIPGLIVAAQFGIVAVAWFQAGLMAVVGLAKLWVASRVLRISLAAQLVAILPAAACGLAAGLAGHAFGRVVEPVVGLVVGIPIVFCVYLALILSFVPDARALAAGLRRHLPWSGVAARPEPVSADVDYFPRK